MTKVKVISEYVGGGFGAKIDLYQHEFVCALLAKKAGKPVLPLGGNIKELININYKVIPQPGS